MSDPVFLTVKQVAELLGVHENWIYEKAGNGTLPSFKIEGLRRFRRDEVLAWVESHRDKPADVRELRRSA